MEIQKQISLTQFQALVISNALRFYLKEIEQVLQNDGKISKDSSRTAQLLTIIYQGEEAKEIQEEISYQFGLLQND